MTTKLDEAYEILRDTGPEYGPMGLSNHAPMAVEALAAVGRADAILPWVEAYARRLGPPPQPHAALQDADWPRGLGDPERYADWVVLFDRQLRDAAWPTVVDAWAARLAPGMAGAALHGLLRAAHAVRAVAARDTPLRRHELAQGLAYWAATFHKLPGDPGGTGTLRPADALRAVTMLPDEQRPEFGLITTGLAQLESFAPFRRVAGLIDVTRRAPSDVLSDLTETFAGAYLSNASPLNLIALIHMLTGPSAVRLFLPHVKTDTARSLVAHAWQAGCALFAVFATTVDAPRLAAAPPGAEELVERALATEDEHAIKFAEACLREEAARPTPVFRAAAADVIQRLAAMR